MRRFLFILPLTLAACEVTYSTGPASAPASDPVASQPSTASFAQVVAAIEPVAEQECRRRTNGTNCDFLIRVDKNPRAEPNAYQSEDPSGRPVITFTRAMIDSTANADELAFVLGHEAAHHISGHLARQAQNAAAGAIIFAGLATLTGGSAADVAAAQQLGEAVGARSYSKEFELEADELGTVITYRAGFDPLLGAQYFTRIADPGDRFLGTHPPNGARIETVRRTSRQLGLIP
ncbi:M48 family metallopeptidase [Seohaeicola saemankumensis]|nr:M48 family metallopeptidase [Seohaeicola saemankumensis]MCA0871250.1 M48 family metallopeptidase [Seohaeicola saemankumensis]